MEKIIREAGAFRALAQIIPSIDGTDGTIVVARRWEAQQAFRRWVDTLPAYEAGIAYEVFRGEGAGERP